jgi:outer membrane protein OmpA-like peptidoglycan-associated protein
MHSARSLLLSLILFALPAAAESGAWLNLHLEPGIALPTSGVTGTSHARSLGLKLDVPIWKGLAVQALGQVHAFPVAGVHSDNALFGFGAGVRYRILDDQQGYFFHLGANPEGHRGNLFGNLWVDAQVLMVRSGLRRGPGLDVGLGVESSLLDGLQIGPYVRYSYWGPEALAVLGLSVSIGIPETSVHDVDRDGDGIPDHLDRCPDDPEDLDGHEDTDGCPDPDNDQDGVLDAADRCPNVAGPAENDGCPDEDRDGDGIVDRLDRCPDAPEDVDGFQDEDGCPDPDNDGDGLRDGDDSCPLQPGPPENKGCPDTDRDGDGIVDRLDECPDEPETFNGVDDEDGCPEKQARVFVEHRRVVITEKVLFEFNKAGILPGSHALLDSVAQVLERFPQIRKLRVDGHTDDQGDEGYNLKLSEERAKAVRDYLIKKGIPEERLEHRGFGKSMPLAEGKDKESRERNRRVEFTITDPVDGIVPVEVPAAGGG